MGIRPRCFLRNLSISNLSVSELRSAGVATCPSLLVYHIRGIPTTMARQTVRLKKAASQLPAHARNCKTYILTKIRYLNRGDTELPSELSSRHKVCFA
eukprot:6192117-Pleurochrysis_carterae.AAC.1